MTDTMPEVDPDHPSFRSDLPVPRDYVREYQIEDLKILTRADGQDYADGRTVMALTAPFNQETPIVDGQGRYREVIDPAAFNRTIDQIRPQGSRAMWKAGVFYNHGMTIHGSPSDSGSRPVGTPIDIRVEPAGLITVTRYAATPLGDEVLELLKTGAMTGHSFTGRIMRSDPEPHSRLGYRPGPGGALPLVRRLELGLREYGPTPFPAYDTTAVLGVRAHQASLDTREDGPPSDIGTSSNEEPAPGDPPPDEGKHSDRSDPDQAVRHAELATKIARARVARPGL